MYRSILSVFAILMITSLTGHVAFSKDVVSDEDCSNRVQKICGDGSIAQCFQDDSKWSTVGMECEGAVQTLIENESDADAQSDTVITAVGMEGFAYGGKLRQGPSMNTPKKASIALGDKITVLEDSGVWMNNYKWFKVRTPRGTGYLWGGIFCLPGDLLPEGVADNCQMLNQ